ncbi:hypothetical protein GOP47_0018851 [Adiantum capillus-veneris]|uniref:Pyrroline-5-carboxylate reductase catalytic N-terminal domain-containing protein n=1 Tax=Adiantum capillus-veneris TaxID=13818 RepID=A0A9D4UEH5_ADICA|nr:hypothetical protein GOP47_0018851 [Adiantum capillus-veneris]
MRRWDLETGDEGILVTRMELLAGKEIGLVPGTGRMALALAAHFCKAGLCVLLGSRDVARAAMAAATLIQAHGPSLAVPLSNKDAAARAHIVVWSPRGLIEEREAMLRDLAPYLEGKIIVDVTNIGYAMDDKEWGQTSSTLRNQVALGVPARWTTAFKATFASVLENKNHEGRFESTVVCGDDVDAVETTIALVQIVPNFIGVRGGGLKNTRIVELLGPPWLIELDELNAINLHTSGWQYVL